MRGPPSAIIVEVEGGLGGSYNGSLLVLTTMPMYDVKSDFRDDESPMPQCIKSILSFLILIYIFIYIILIFIIFPIDYITISDHRLSVFRRRAVYVTWFYSFFSPVWTYHVAGQYNNIIICVRKRGIRWFRSGIEKSIHGNRNARSVDYAINILQHGSYLIYKWWLNQKES